MIDGWILVLVLSSGDSPYCWCRSVEPNRLNDRLTCIALQLQIEEAPPMATPTSVHWRSTIAVRDRSCADSPRFTPSNRTLPSQGRWS